MINSIISKNIFKNIAWPLVIAMFFIGDRILKNIALNQGQSDSLNLIGSWLKFRLVWNPNIAFSLPVSGILLNIVISLLVTCLLSLIIYLIFKKSNQKRLILLLTIILFGAISNLLDRYLYGAVIDYFDLQYFTIFNLADTMISVGTILVLFFSARKN